MLYCIIFILGPGGTQPLVHVHRWRGRHAGNEYTVLVIKGEDVYAITGNLTRDEHTGSLRGGGMIYWLRYNDIEKDKAADLLMRGCYSTIIGLIVVRLEPILRQIHDF